MSNAHVAFYTMESGYRDPDGHWHYAPPEDNGGRCLWQITENYIENGEWVTCTAGWEFVDYQSAVDKCTELNIKLKEQF